MKPRLTPTEAAILAALHRAKTWVSVERLSELTADASHLYDHAADRRGPKAVCVHIHSIRKKLGEDSILSMWGRGYTLGATGVRPSRSAMMQAAA